MEHGVLGLPRDAIAIDITIAGVLFRVMLLANS